MKLIEKNGVKALIFESFKSFKITAAFSTRVGGVSSGCYESLNFSSSTGDDKENVVKNFELFSDALGFDSENYIISNQVHNDLVIDVDETYRGSGLYKERPFKGVDGFITDKKGLVLTTFYADCVPLYFYDTKKEIIGVCHSGWKGTAKNIASKMIEKFKEKGSNLADIIVGIGPSICKDCFETGYDVIFEFEKYPYIKECFDYNDDKNKYYIDLKLVNKRHLLELGILEKNIEISKDCTYENEELFFSHRRMGEKRGSQIGLIFFDK